MGNQQVHIADGGSARALRSRRRAAYGAGPGLDQALGVCRRLQAYGLASIVGYAASTRESPRAVADAHLAALARLAREDVDCYVSVKLSTLGFDAALFAELEGAAAQAGRRLHVDALAPEVAGDTWALLEGPPRDGRVGTTLPGRWHRSPGDTALAARLGLVVRVVKGQWADDAGAPEIPAAEGFLHVVDRLAGHPQTVAVATHDVRLLEAALARLAAARTRCEVELFYGLPFRAPAQCARRAGAPLRIYVPYGHTGAPYGRAELTHNPAATWWLVQDLMLGPNKTWRGIRRSRLHA
jgi:proline dehydrogenase